MLQRVIEKKTSRRVTPTRRLKVAPLSEVEIEGLKGTIEGGPVRITEPKLQSAIIKIIGVAPYVQHAFSEKARKKMEEAQMAGQQGRGKRVREPKNFDEVFESAKHYSEEGWLGIPAPAFRNAMIDACRLCGFKMTHAKLSVFVEHDGIDKEDGTPLVKIFGTPVRHVAAVRNETGVADIRHRPMWKKWTASPKIRWDVDQFSATDVHNLLLRAGLQVGIGEGRPGSPRSNGMGWGRFEIDGRKLKEFSE